MIRCLFYIVFLGATFTAGLAGAQEVVRVKKVVFEGNQVLGKDLLGQKMTTQSKNLIGKLMFWKRSPEFRLSVLKNDVVRLKKLYQRNGFLSPEIRYELQSLRKGKKVVVMLRIEENRYYLLDTIRWQLQGIEAAHLLDAFLKENGVDDSLRFEDAYVLKKEQQLTRLFKDHGYPFVQLKRRVQLDTLVKKAVVDVQVFPGKKAFWGDVRVEGDSLIPEAFVLKKVRLEEGGVYSQKKLDNAQNHLYKLGLFRYVTVRALLDSVQGDTVPVLVRVKELPKWSLRLGLGYGTEDRIRLSAALTKLSFLGGARRLIMKGETSYYQPFNIELRFIQPDFINTNKVLLVNPFYLREREQSYEVDRLGAGITLQKEFRNKLSAYLTYTVGNDQVHVKQGDISGFPDDVKHNKSGFTLGSLYNTTNDIFSPDKGVYFSAQMTLMGVGFRSKYHYYELQAEVKHFSEITYKWVLATKLKAGVINPILGDRVSPLEDRFLMGGAMSLRGWRRNTISPRDENANLVGGDSMLEGSVELRFPIYDIFSGVLFGDVGNVWQKAWKQSLLDLKYNAGLGFRCATPIGPVRLDSAIPLFEGSASPLFYITIGHAF